MSHLLNEIQGNTLDKNGDVNAPSINDLDDVLLSTPSNNQVLKYDEGNSRWINDSWAMENFHSIFYTNGYSLAGATGYTYPPPYYMDPDYYAFIRINATGGVVIANAIDLNTDIVTTKHNANPGATNSIYGKGFQIAAGVKAILSADMVCEGTNSTAYRDVRWETTSGTALGPIQRVQVLSGKNRHTVWGYIDASVDTEVALKMTDGSGTIGFNQDTQTRDNVIVMAKRIQ